MSLEDLEYEENHDVARLREELLAVQASNVALASIIATLPETAKLDHDQLMSACSLMSEMDAHTEMATGQFLKSILDISKHIHGREEL